MPCTCLHPWRHTCPPGLRRPRLDKQRKGYVNFVDWGGLDLNHVIEMFTLLYMRKFMGLPDTAASDEQVCMEPTPRVESQSQALIS